MGFKVHKFIFNIYCPARFGSLNDVNVFLEAEQIFLSYHIIYHMYLFHLSEVYSYNNKGFTIDI